MPPELSHEYFSRFLNIVFHVSAADLQSELKLAEVEILNPEQTPGPRQPFALIFEGDRESVLPGGIYAFRHESAEPFEINLNPIVSTGDRQVYQAVFS